MIAKRTIKIGNAGGFWGDSLSAPARLVQQQPDLDFLTLDYLAEVSMSILAIQRKDAFSGYAKDFIDVVRSLIPLWKAGAKVKVVTNAGGLNPRGCAQACFDLLKEHGLDKQVGLVEGDDVLPFLKADPESDVFRNLETNNLLEEIKNELVTANAYLGAEPIAQALRLGADIVVTGRVADPSLTVGPCIYHYEWQPHDYHKIAGATVAGHLIECGTQATGGISTHWLSIQDKTNIGFPVVEVFEDGSCLLTKPAGTGGEVSLRTTKEQLLYEIGDPSCYLSPDATVSFLGITLEEKGPDRILITGVRGSEPPPTYKVSATYKNGFRADATLAIPGPDARLKAEICGKIVRERVRLAGYALDDFQIDCVGGGALFSHLKQSINEPVECMLRMAAADRRKEAVECFAREIAPLVTSGPQGITGYISGRPKIRQVFGYWPCLIARELEVKACLFNG